MTSDVVVIVVVVVVVVGLSSIPRGSGLVVLGGGGETRWVPPGLETSHY